MFDPNQRVSVEVALERTLERVSRLGTELVSLDQSYGRVLAQNVVSDIDVSPFANAGMDGYAVHAEDIAQATEQQPVCLNVVGNIGAGSCYDEALKHGEAVRIMTGAPIPEGTTAVIKYELVGIESGDGGTDSVVSFTAPSTKPFENIRAAGEECKAGDVVLEAGTTIDPYAMGLAASAGCVELQVYRQPRVGIFAIGSELVAAPRKPERGMIRDCNTMCLTGLAQSAGAIPVVYPIVVDDRAAIEARIERALDECDMVVSAGGASQGDFDFIHGIISEKGSVAYSYMSLRPGKRQTMGVIDGKPVFGLSGNPAAASVGFELLIRPALRKMQGFAALKRPVVEAELSCSIKKREGRRFYQRGNVERAEDGRMVAHEYGSQSSALLGDLQHSNCLIVVPEESMGMHEGEKVMCIRIDTEEGHII